MTGQKCKKSLRFIPQGFSSSSLCQKLIQDRCKLIDDSLGRAGAIVDRRNDDWKSRFHFLSFCGMLFAQSRCIFSGAALTRALRLLYFLTD